MIPQTTWHGQIFYLKLTYRTTDLSCHRYESHVTGRSLSNSLSSRFLVHKMEIKNQSLQAVQRCSIQGTFLAVQWLRLHLLCREHGFNPWWGNSGHSICDNLETHLTQSFIPTLSSMPDTQYALNISAE